MNRNTLLGLLLGWAIVLPTNADQIGEVCYKPLWGEAITRCTPDFDKQENFTDPCPRMLGQYKILLQKTTVNTEKAWMKLKGPLHGSVNHDGTLNHILGDQHGEGLIYSFGDTLLEMIPVNECELQVKEKIYITLGTGEFSGAYGNITVDGLMNQCTGVNELAVMRSDDQICFAILD